MAALVAHFLVRPLARFEVLELRVDVAFVLTSQIGNFNVVPYAINAMTGGAFGDNVGETGPFSSMRKRNKRRHPAQKRHEDDKTFHGWLSSLQPTPSLILPPQAISQARRFRLEPIRADGSRY
jgi:hypothetical protein